jgi:hypothetical protein
MAQVTPSPAQFVSHFVSRSASKRASKRGDEERGGAQAQSRGPSKAKKSLFHVCQHMSEAHTYKKRTKGTPYVKKTPQ